MICRPRHAATLVAASMKRTCPTLWPVAATPLDGEVAADVADAEAALAKLNVQASSLVDTEALARLLLRAESVAVLKDRGA